MSEAMSEANHSVSPPPPPPKLLAINLNSSTRSTDPQTGAKWVRRAFHCDVIIRDGLQNPEVQTLLAHLGTPLREAGESDASDPLPVAIGEGKHDPIRLKSLAEELLRTERSYVQRMKALKSAYADPLRNFARRPDQMIIPVYEAKTLFANVDAVLVAAEGFLASLLAVDHEDIASACLSQLANGTLDPYQSYISKQDESQRIFQDVVKKFPAFTNFIESTKYSTTGIGNIGLRELLMEPVQRIPRYTLLWSTMAKCYPPTAEARDHLCSAIRLASRIAKCDPSEQTIRATVMYSLERAIDGFPANLFSNNRNFIDCLDVEEHDVGRAFNPNTASSLSSISTASSANTSQQAAVQYCTLFLFDDKLMIVKRQSSSVSGRHLTGLADVEKLVKTGGGVSVIGRLPSKKDKLAYRGVVDIRDIIVTDIGNGDFQVYFEHAPAAQSGKWSRQTRTYSTVNPPYGQMETGTNRRDKMRFVENLWTAQARFNKSRALVSSEVDLYPGSNTLYRSYWTMSTGTHARASNVVMQIDPSGSFTIGDPGSSLLFQLQPLAGGFTRFSFRGSDGDIDRSVIDVSEVAENVLNTIHASGLFSPKAPVASAPTTPSSTHRMRSSMLNLDSISRNLFGNTTLSSRDASVPTSANSRSPKKRASLDGKTKGDRQSGNFTILEDKSEIDLDQRLQLARKNSNMPARSPIRAAASHVEASMSPTSMSLRLIDSPTPSSPTSTRRDQDSQLRASVAGEQTSLQRLAGIKTDVELSNRRSVDVSQAPIKAVVSPPSKPSSMSSPSRIIGPRSLYKANVGHGPDDDSHLRSARSIVPAASPSSAKSGARRDLPLSPHGPSPLVQSPTGPPPSVSNYGDLGVGQSSARVMQVAKSLSVTSKVTVENHGHRRISNKRQHSADLLQPRKRSDSRSPLHPREIPQVETPPPVPDMNGLYTSKISDVHSLLSVDPSHDVAKAPQTEQDLDSLLQLAKDKILDSRAVVRRLRVEIAQMKKLREVGSLPRSPQRRNITRLAGHEFEVIAKSDVDSIVSDEATRGLASMAQRLDQDLKYTIDAIAKASRLSPELLSELDRSSREISQLREQVSRAKETQQLLREQLDEAHLEADVVYEAFNTELDGIFQDANLPESDAMLALQSELQSVTAKRNELALENTRLKQELQESHLKREQWSRMLKSQGIIS